MKPDSNINPIGRPRKKRWLRATYALVGIVISVILVYHYLTTPQRIRQLAMDYIQLQTQQAVSIDRAEFSLFGGTHLYGVTIGETPHEKKHDSIGDDSIALQPLFTCQELHLIHQPLSAMIGQLRIDNVIATQPTCTIIHNEETGVTNLSKLFPLQQLSGTNKTVRLPMIELRDSRIAVYKQNGHDIQKIDELRLTIRGRPTQHDVNQYRIAWNKTGVDTSGGHSQINLTSGSVRNTQGGLPAMNIEAVMLAVNTRYDGVGAWSTLLGLTGQVQASDYRLTLNSTDSTPNWITLKLTDASLSVPMDQHDKTLPRHQRYVQVEHVHGSVTIHADSITAQFTGLFHGSPCQVSTTIRSGTNTLATLDDTNITAIFKIEDLSLPQINDPAAPEQTRFIYHWPQLARYYRIFDPQGKATIEVEIEKKSGADQPLNIKYARLIARNISGAYRNFPYAVHDVNGEIEFTPEGIFLHNLTGKHNEGIFVVDGKIDHPSMDSPAKLHLHATGIPIDDSLYIVLPSKYREMIDTFSPRGLIDMDAELIRPESSTEHPAKWNINTAVSFENLSALYKKFLYPFEHLSGVVRLDQDQIHVSNVTGKMGEGDVHLEGLIDLSTGKIKNLDLVITGKNIAMDEQLFAALPASLKKTTDAFRPSGKFDVISSLEHSDVAPMTYRSYRFQFADVQINHQELPIPYRHISGDVTLTPHQFIVHQMNGKFHDGELTAEGSIAHAKSISFTDFTMRGKNIRIDEEFLSALPNHWLVSYAKWNVEGIANTTINLTSSGDNAHRRMQIQTSLQLTNASVSHDDLNIDFQNVSADLNITHGHVAATRVQMDFRDARITGSFEIQNSSESQGGSAKLSATGLTLNDELREVMPVRLHDLWDQIKPTGKVDLLIDPLRFECSAHQPQTTWSIDGEAVLHDVTLGKPARYKNLNGTVYAQGMLFDPSAGTVLNGSLDLHSSVLFEHPLTQVKSAWSLAHTRDGLGHLTMNDFQGKLYDGDVAATLNVFFEPGETTYDLSSIIQNMDIRPYIKASQPQPKHDQNNKSSEIRGWVDAQLYLTGAVGKKKSRRGEGRVEIQNGYFYRMPIILSILHVLNLTIPDQDAFEEAMTSFFIVDRNVQLDDIRIRSQHLSLVGNGTMTLPDMGVDLNLVYVNDNQLNRLPVIAEIFNGASRQVMPLHVTGPLHSPTVRAMPFKDLTDEFKKLFKKKPQKKRKVIKP